MRLPSGLAGRIGLLGPEFARFCVIGSIAFGTADAGSNLLRFQAGLDPLSSNAIATIAATVFAFVGNRYWTFRHRQRVGVSREGPLFLGLNLAALLIQLSCIAFTSYALGLSGKLAYNVALIAGIGLATLFRFWSYRKWVWHAAPAAPASAPQGTPQVRA